MGVTSLPSRLRTEAPIDPGILVAKLEDVSDLDGFAETHGLAVNGVELAFVDVADVCGEGGGEIAAGGYVAVSGSPAGWLRRRGCCDPGGRGP